MTYRSQAQKNWAHSKEGMDALGGPGKVAEWDKASEGLDLPERSQAPVSKKKEKPKPTARRSSGIKWV
jgi:hypothetical protein